MIDLLVNKDKLIYVRSYLVKNVTYLVIMNLLFSNVIIFLVIF